MQPEISVNWFLAQAVLCVGAWMTGRAIGRNSHAWGEILLATLATMSIFWAMRDRAASVLLDFFPLDSWVYLEGTVIAPPVLLVAGALSVHPHQRRARWLGPALALFGSTYFAFHGAWMLRPSPNPATLDTVRYTSGPTMQSRADSCSAAAMATALRACNLGLVVSEADMARFADLRAGAGATPARVVRGLRMAMTGTALEPTLVTLNAGEVAHVASPDMPALVTLRTGGAQHHMVVLYGRTRAGLLHVFNPAEDGSQGALMDPETFRRRYTGSAIVMLPRESPARNPTMLGAH
ncbi:MAG: hypothetical protein ACF8QF_11030 [Phycisphaerales bacterium]